VKNLFGNYESVELLNFSEMVSRNHLVIDKELDLKL
jgi:hypothetical protein